MRIRQATARPVERTRQRQGWPTPDTLAATLLGFIVAVGVALALIGVLGAG